MRYYQSCMMTGDATLSRHARYSVNRGDGLNPGQSPQSQRAYIKQNGRRNELWLV